MKNFLIASVLVLTAALPAHKAMACSLVIPSSNLYVTINGVSDEQRADLKPVLTDSKGKVIGLSDSNGTYETASTAVGKFNLTLNYKSEVVLTHEVEVKKGACYAQLSIVTVNCDTTPAGSLSCTAN